MPTVELSELIMLASAKMVKVYEQEFESWVNSLIESGAIDRSIALQNGYVRYVDVVHGVTFVMLNAELDRMMAGEVYYSFEDMKRFFPWRELVPQMMPLVSRSNKVRFGNGSVIARRVVDFQEFGLASRN